MEGPGEGKGIARAGSTLLPGRVFALVPIPSFQEFMFTSKILKRSCSVEWNKVEMGYDPVQTLGLGFLMHESSGCVCCLHKRSHITCCRANCPVNKEKDPKSGKRLNGLLASKEKSSQETPVKAPARNEVRKAKASLWTWTNSVPASRRLMAKAPLPGEQGEIFLLKCHSSKLSCVCLSQPGQPSQQSLKTDEMMPCCVLMLGEWSCTTCSCCHLPHRDFHTTCKRSNVVRFLDSLLR